MGHLVGKDIYKDLAGKIDGLGIRAPFNSTFYEILKTLYSPGEAEIIVKMPYGLASLEKIARSTGCDKVVLKGRLDSLAGKGLVIDVCIRNRFFYIISPMVIGIFEFTMMRTDRDIDHKKMAGLFREYMEDSNLFFAANFGSGQKVSPMRVLPWEETFSREEYVEILDYEKAKAIIQNNKIFAIGICSCRHKKSHSEEGACDVPMEKCSVMGRSAEYMIRNGLATEVTKSRMLENLDESRDLGLVINADNVRKGCDFMCHCCKCCCICLTGISHHGFPNIVVSSRFLARPDYSLCTGCGVCAKACPISVIFMKPGGGVPDGRDTEPQVDQDLCIGCGVCALRCRNGSMNLVQRKQRIIQPENVFERIILQCLERGTLQNQMFPEPEDITHRFMRSFVGGILRLPPVKAALMSDLLRSRFIETVVKMARQ